MMHLFDYTSSIAEDQTRASEIFVEQDPAYWRKDSKKALSTRNKPHFKFLGKICKKGIALSSSEDIHFLKDAQLLANFVN